MSSRTFLTKSLRIFWDGMRHDAILCPTWYQLALVATGIFTPLHCQASNSVAIVRELRSTPWSFAHHSVCDQGNCTGIGGIHIQARWSLWHSTDDAWEQCSISLWRATHVPSSLIVTYRLLTTFFSASLTSYCLHTRCRSPGQHESTPL